jgi:hypothetical protein
MRANPPHPPLWEVPIGIDGSGTRVEGDSMGDVEVAYEWLLGRTDTAKSHSTGSIDTECGDLIKRGPSKVLR